MTRDDLETINVIMKSYFSQYAMDRKYLMDAIYMIRQFQNGTSELRMDGFSDVMSWVRGEYDFDGDLRNLVALKDLWIDKHNVKYEMINAREYEKVFKDLSISRVNDINRIAFVIRTSQGVNLCFTKDSIVLSEKKEGWYCDEMEIVLPREDRLEVKVIKDIMHRLVDKTVETVSGPLEVKEVFFMSPKRDGVKNWLYSYGQLVYLLDARGVVVKRFDVQTVNTFLVLVEVVEDVIYMIDVLLYQDHNVVSLLMTERIAYMQHIEREVRLPTYELVMQVFHMVNIMNEVQIATIATTAEEGVIFTPNGFYSDPVIKYKRFDTIDIELEWKKDAYMGDVEGHVISRVMNYVGPVIVCEFRVDYRDRRLVFDFVKWRHDRLRPNAPEVIRSILTKVSLGRYPYHHISVYVRSYLRTRFYSCPRSSVSGIPSRDKSQWLRRIESIVTEYAKLGWCRNELIGRVRKCRFNVSELIKLASNANKLEEYIISITMEGEQYDGGWECN